ncbi:MAG: ECF transporter S component [Clostridia bacterium]|nr:ECF transporter S component [Clostridia bacterium]
MIKRKNRRMKTETLVIASLMTALVVVFQCLATYTTFFGPFSTAIGLIPIVIGAAMCGPLVGAWLGFVFAIVVILTGGANLFFMFSVPGTIITVLAKGIACGFVSGVVYKALKQINKTVAVIAAAIICPVVNTGIFLLGSAIFFIPFAEKIGSILGMSEAGFALFIALAFGNFLFELGMNAVLSPIIVRVIDMRKKK